MVSCRSWTTPCQRRVSASPGMKGRGWRLCSVLCRLFPQDLSSDHRLIRARLVDTHEFTCLVCVNDSETRGGAEYGSGGGAREENDRDGCQRNLGDILLPSVPCIGEGGKAWEENNYITGWYFHFIELCVCVCVQGSVGTGVQVLSVSHGGIKLLKTVKSSAAAPDYFRVLRPYTYVHVLYTHWQIYI